MRTSGSSSAHQSSATLRDYLQVVRRRKWIIIQAVVLVPLAAVLFSLQQTPVYQASAGVLLSRQNLANTLNGIQDPSVYTQADRLAQTQADLARSPEVARRVLAQLHLTDRTVGGLLANSSVTPAQNADVLGFTVKDTNRALAAQLAGAYAEQYRAYRHQLDTQALQAARQEVLNRINSLPEKRGALYANLVDKEQQLSTMEALQTSNATVMNEPTSASPVSPRPKRNAILGLMLGLVLGVGFAFLRETLDTRVRSAQEIGDRLGLPLLARIPEPPKNLRVDDKLAMLAEPAGIQAEAFRMLRTNLEFTALGHDVHCVMITSALEQEGKSTTIANLAIALARGGQRVILVDLDLRRPYVYDSGGATVDVRATRRTSLDRFTVDDRGIAEALDQTVTSSQKLFDRLFMPFALVIWIGFTVIGAHFGSDAGGIVAFVIALVVTSSLSHRTSTELLTRDADGARRTEIRTRDSEPS